MFETKNPFFYIFGFSIIFITSYFANKFKKHFDNKHDECEMIKKYLLNDSPLYGYNKPKIWIHTKYELNARKWASFYSRNNTDLNQPYIHLTVKSIINHCGEDFNVCLIDDDTFSKLIPSWNYNLNVIAEPMKSRVRTMGLCQLVYYYGGMVVPNSFLCLKNLKPLYNNGILNNKLFVCENVNHCSNILKEQTKSLFIPNLNFFGSSKNNELIKNMIEILKQTVNQHHVSNEIEFLGKIQYWCLENAKINKINLIDGLMIGIKSTNNKPILIDDLLGEQYLDISKDSYGILIPENEILERTKYKWFAVMSSEQILNTDMIITKYIKNSIVEHYEYYNKSSIIPSAVAI
jgi:hypothetical protein